MKVDAYDNGWDTPNILKVNREIVKSVRKITNPVASNERKRELKHWSMTIEDIYLGEEQNAIANIKEKFFVIDFSGYVLIPD